MLDRSGRHRVPGEVAPLSRIDDLARGLALRPARTSAVGDTRAETAGLPLERVARAAATPMSRRRALRVLGGALITAAAPASLSAAARAAPARAQGCTACGVEHGAGCVGNYKCGQGALDGEPVCCTFPGYFGPLRAPFGGTCAQAGGQGNTPPGGAMCCCPAGSSCGEPAVAACTCPKPCASACCQDDEDCVMGDRLAPDTDFCAPRCPPLLVHCQGTGTCCERGAQCCGTGCCSGGQCCNRDGRQWCCPHTQTCGDSAGTCTCAFGQRCGDKCCPTGSECCRNSLVLDIFNISGRRAGRVSRYSCCSPGLEKQILDYIESIPSVFAFGGSSASIASIGRAAAAGSADALVALAAVSHLAALAGDRLRSGRSDANYRRRVRARKPALRPIAPGPGLDAAAARALDQLVSTEARAWALVDAWAVAHARSLGAIRARNARAAVTQARASGRFAAQAAKALRPVPDLRKAAAAALEGAGTPEVTVSEREVAAFQDSVRRGGLPADTRARLTQLGLDRAEQKRVAALILRRQPGSAAGNVLIAPLADASTLATMSRLATQLARQATRARKQPITVTAPGPRKAAGTSPRPHAAQSSQRRRRGST